MLICEENPKLIADQDIDISYLENSSTAFDFQEVIQTSKLDNSLKNFQIDQL